MKTEEIHISFYNNKIKGDGVINISIQCLHCIHLHKTIINCDAFPLGIPKKIIEGNFDHSKSYKNDNGIRFEAFKSD